MRHEVKYCVNTRDVPAIARRLGEVLSIDDHAGSSGGYDIRSLYFDDAERSAYFDKLAGVSDRVKYRLRIYNGQSDRIFLERKKKHGDVVDKQTVAITKSLADRIISGETSGLDASKNALLNDMFARMTIDRLSPIVIVDYHRQAFVHPGGNTRVTIDTRVRSGLHNTDMFDGDILTVDAMDTAMSILEVKYDEMLPDFISAAVSCFPASRSAISKYVMCCRYVI